MEASAAAHRRDGEVGPGAGAGARGERHRQVLARGGSEMPRGVGVGLERPWDQRAERVSIFLKTSFSGSLSWRRAWQRESFVSRRARSRISSLRESGWSDWRGTGGFFPLLATAAAASSSSSSTSSSSAAKFYSDAQVAK